MGICPQCDRAQTLSCSQRRQTRAPLTAVAMRDSPNPIPNCSKVGGVAGVPTRRSQCCCRHWNQRIFSGFEEQRMPLANVLQLPFHACYKTWWVTKDQVLQRLSPFCNPARSTFANGIRYCTNTLYPSAERSTGRCNEPEHWVGKPLLSQVF